MSYELNLRDYGYFIKKNLKTIIGTMLVVLAAFLVWMFIGSSEEGDTPSVALEEHETLNEDQLNYLMNTYFWDLEEDEQDLLMNYLEEEAYSFQLYIENADGTSFSNHEALKEFLIREDMVNRVESETNAEFLPDPERGVIVFNDGNGLHTIQVGVGERVANQQIAETYYQVIEESALPILEERSVYFLDEVPVYAAEEESSDEEEEIVVEESIMSNVLTAVVMGLIALAGGAIIGLLLALLLNSFKKTVSGLYDYAAQPGDKVIRFKEDQSSMSLEQLLQNIAVNASAPVTIVADASLFNFNKVLDNELNSQNVSIIKHLSEAPQNLSRKEVLILAKDSVTTKKWYREQRALLVNNSSPVSVVHVY